MRWTSVSRLIAAAVGSGVVLIVPPVGADTSPIIPVSNLANALNRGDADSAMATFSDSPTVMGAECAEGCAGREAVRSGFVDTEIQGGTRVNLTGWETTDDTASSGFKVRSRELREAGFSRLVGTVDARVADGRIDDLAITLDPNDPDTARFLAAMGGGPGEAAAAARPTRLARTGDGSTAQTSPGPIELGAVVLAAAAVLRLRRVLR